MPILQMPTSFDFCVRYYKKVDWGELEDCWLWNAGLRGGYGALRINYRNYSVHRLMYWMATGVDPGKLKVCHHCDCRACVNPAHLWLGTHEDNNRDMVEKGRQARGVMHGRVKLSEANVIAIYTSHGLTQKELAERFGVSQKAISFIRGGERWGWLTKGLK